MTIQDKIEKLLNRENTLSEVTPYGNILFDGLYVEKLESLIRASVGLVEIAQGYCNDSFCEPLCVECWPCDFNKALAVFAAEVERASK